MRRGKVLLVLVIAILFHSWPRNIRAGAFLGKTYGISASSPLSRLLLAAKTWKGASRIGRSHRLIRRRATAFGEAEDRRPERDNAMAWLEEHLRSVDGQMLGRALFLTPEENRARQAVRGTENIKSFMKDAAKTGSADTMERATDDSLFLAVYHLGAQSGTWLGADQWQNAAKREQSVPGLKTEDVEQVLLRELYPNTVTAEELREVVTAFIASMWGDARKMGMPERIRNETVITETPIVISTPPQHVATQYCIGVLWGYAMRGLVMRLALDRALGTLPEKAKSQKRRLELQLADSNESWEAANSFEAERPSTLLQYASEFFGHKDWMDLCQPTDVAISFIENELEEAVPGLSMLAEAQDDFAEFEEMDAAMMIGDGEDGDYDEDDGDYGEEIDEAEVMRMMEQSEYHELDEEDMAELEAMEEDGMMHMPQHDLMALQRRAISMGSLLADAEAFVNAELDGLLPRGKRQTSQWAGRMVEAGVLSGIAQEQTQMIASRLVAPHQRLLRALKTKLLPSKLQSARQGLKKLMKEKDAAEPGTEEAK